MFKLGLQIVKNEITIDKIFFDWYIIFFGGTVVTDLVWWSGLYYIFSGPMENEVGSGSF